MKTLLIAALAASSVLLAPTALADSNDQAFLAALKANQFYNSGGEDIEIQLAHQICTGRIRGMTEQQVVDSLKPDLRNGMTVADLTLFVQISEKFYCPNPSQDSRGIQPGIVV